jgi:hypothetical protein
MAIKTEMTIKNSMMYGLASKMSVMSKILVRGELGTLRRSKRSEATTGVWEKSIFVLITTPTIKAGH